MPYYYDNDDDDDMDWETAKATASATTTAIVTFYCDWHVIITESLRCLLCYTMDCLLVLFLNPDHQNVQRNWIVFK